MSRSLKVFLFWLAAALATSSLQAEYRSYTSSRPAEEVLDSIFANLKKSGFQYRIRRVLSEKSDGRMGVLLWLFPGKNHCEISFYPQVGKPGTLVRIFTQDTRDAGRFHNFLTEIVKLHPEGMVQTTKGQAGDPWPAPR